MSKEAWCGFNGWQPVAHTYDGAAYMAPILTSEEAWSKIKETISNSKPGEFYRFDADGNAKLMFVNEAPSHREQLKAAYKAGFDEGLMDGYMCGRPCDDETAEEYVKGLGL